MAKSWECMRNFTYTIKQIKHNRLTPPQSQSLHSLCYIETSFNTDALWVNWSQDAAACIRQSSLVKMTRLKSECFDASGIKLQLSLLWLSFTRYTAIIRIHRHCVQDKVHHAAGKHLSCWEGNCNLVVHVSLMNSFITILFFMKFHVNFLK